jgi:hypothetical protein
MCGRMNFAQYSSFLIFLRRNLYGSYPKDSEFQNSEHEVHQVALLDSGSQNFSFLAFKGKAVGVTQISSYNAARQTEKNYRSNFVISS